jgi:hypothetical protein
MLPGHVIYGIIDAIGSTCLMNLSPRVPSSSFILYATMTGTRAAQGGSVEH